MLQYVCVYVCVRAWTACIHQYPLPPLRSIHSTHMSDIHILHVHVTHTHIHMYTHLSGYLPLPLTTPATHQTMSHHHHHINSHPTTTRARLGVRTLQISVWPCWTFHLPLAARLR